MDGLEDKRTRGKGAETTQLSSMMGYDGPQQKNASSNGARAQIERPSRPPDVCGITPEHGLPLTHKNEELRHSAVQPSVTDQSRTILQFIREAVHLAPREGYRIPGSLPGLYLTNKPEARSTDRNSSIQDLDDLQEANLRTGAPESSKRKRSTGVISAVNKEGPDQKQGAPAPATKKMRSEDASFSTAPIEKPQEEASETVPASHQITNIEGDGRAASAGNGASVSGLDVAGVITENERLRAENAKLKQKESAATLRNQLLSFQAEKLRKQLSHASAQEHGFAEQSRNSSKIIQSHHSLASSALFASSQANVQTTLSSAVAYDLGDLGLASTYGTLPAPDGRRGYSKAQPSLPKHLLFHPNTSSSFALGDLLWAPNCCPSLDPKANPMTNSKFASFPTFTAQGCQRLAVVVRIHDYNTIVVVWIESAGGWGPNMIRCKSGYIFRVVSISNKTLYGTKTAPENLPITAVMKRGQQGVTEGSYADISNYCTVSYELKVEHAGKLLPGDALRFQKAFDQLSSPPRIPPLKH